jgi:hypothetical protein
MEERKILCKICGSKFHYQTFCSAKPRKPIKAKMTIISSKPKKPLKRSYIKPKSTTSARKILVYKLDSVFSTYIRLRDAVGAKARCVTCGAVRHYKEMQNGHFIPRGSFPVRWDEMNCHVQCKYCNETLSGNLPKYRIYMNTKYGVQAVEELKLKSVTGPKISTPDLREMIEYYTAKVKELTENA